VVSLLFGVAVVPFVLLYFISPALFPFVFGEEWVLAGKYAQVFCLMFLLNFVSMPTRWVFMVAGKQRLEFVWQILFFIFSICPVVVGILRYDIFTTIILWSIGKSIAYLIYLMMTYYIAKTTLVIPYIDNKIVTERE
jgi:O-antigen/teichoic acid export membrane protein